MFSRTVPRNIVGRCGSHPIWRRQACRSSVARSRPSTGRTGVRPAQAEQQGRRSALAGAAGPGQDDDFAAPQFQVELVAAPLPAVGVLHGDTGERDLCQCRGTSALAASARWLPSDVEDPPGRCQAVGARVEEGAQGAQRRVESRGEEEHDQAARSVRPPPMSRTPTVTATSAVPRVAARSSTAPERNDSRSTRMVPSR